MKKKELLERIEYLEDKLLDLQESDTRIYEWIQNISQLIALSDLNPANRKRSKTDNS